MVDENRMCPGCNELIGQVVHAEKFDCPNCSESVLMEYLSCPCRYSWREINGVFLDGGRIEIDGLEGLLQGINDFIEDYESENRELSPSSMESIIHHCLKCNELAVQIRSNPDVYRCTECSFEWEVDTFNE